MELDRQIDKPLETSNRSFCERRDKVLTLVARVGKDDDNTGRTRGKRNEGIC